MTLIEVVVIALVCGAAMRVVIALQDRRELRQLRRELFLATQLLRCMAFCWGEDDERIRAKLIDVVRQHDLARSQQSKPETRGRHR